MSSLRPGDVLSFSSGFQQRGPHGFRVLRNEKGGLLNLLKTRWPQLLEPFEGRTPMVINAYPACIGRFEFAVVVDSYLSGSIVSLASTATISTPPSTRWRASAGRSRARSRSPFQVGRQIETLGADMRRRAE